MAQLAKSSVAWVLAMLMLRSVIGCNTRGRDSADAALAVVPDSAATLVVDVGGGDNNFVPLENGSSVDVVSGPQGGFHIWTSVRVHDPSVSLVQINLSLRFEDTGAPAGRASRVAASLDPPVEGARVHVHMTNFVDDPQAVRGRRVVMRAEVIADDERHGAGELVVVP